MSDSYTTSGGVNTAHHHRAKPTGAFIAAAGSVILFISMWLPWTGIGPGDRADRVINGYEADSTIPFMGCLAIGFALALLYALKRADRKQHRGLSLASFAAGLGSTLWILLFAINPIETVKYAGYLNESNRPDVPHQWGLYISLLGALIWTIGSFLLAKEPEGDIEHDSAVHGVDTVRHQNATRTVPTDRYSETTEVKPAHVTDTRHVDTNRIEYDGDVTTHRTSTDPQGRGGASHL
jgi:hypothetical protein